MADTLIAALKPIADEFRARDLSLPVINLASLKAGCQLVKEFEDRSLQCERYSPATGEASVFGMQVYWPTEDTNG